MEKKISYLNRNFDDYRKSLIDFSREYYPTLTDTFNDASVGSWIIDLMASVSDNLSFLADRVFQETSVNSAQQMSSLMNLARSKGLKVPGPKASVAEVELTCVLPVSAGTTTDASTTRHPYWDYAPILRKGMQFAAGSQIFELMDDVDFSHQFDNNGYSDRTINVNRNPNGMIVSYTIGKRALVSAGRSKIYKRVIRSSDIVPFMEFIIPDRGVMNVESVIFKDGTDFMSDPDISEFEFTEEFTSEDKNRIGKVPVWTYFEVDSLSDQSRWGEVLQSDGNPVTYEYKYSDDSDAVHHLVTKGEWKPLKQKFMTEFTDMGYLKVIFGAGLPEGQNVDFSNASDFGKYQISKMINNDSLGVLPRRDMTMYIRYRVGGGAASNVAEGAINTIAYYDVQIGCGANIDPQVSEAVRRTISVRNVTPSVSGKDMPTEAEVRNLIKYSNGAQNRCVTVKDYYERILKLPAKYGTPYRIGVLEENNKIKINVLGIDNERHLSAVLPDLLARNIVEYLKEYKMVTDYVEVRSGKVINISVEADIYIDKNYNKSSVIKQVIDTIYDYMDVSKHRIGEDIYVGDIIKEVMKVDGLINVFDIRVFNEYGGRYSLTESTLPRYTGFNCDDDGKSDGYESIESNRFRIDVAALDGILYSDSESMYEIKYKDTDIRVRARER
jgi:hypothetical protein